MLGNVGQVVGKIFDNCREDFWRWVWEPCGEQLEMFESGNVPEALRNDWEMCGNWVASVRGILGMYSGSVWEPVVKCSGSVSDVFPEISCELWHR